MGYRFYVDTFVITLFLVDCLAMLAVLYLMKLRIRFPRLFLLAGASAIAETLLFMVLPSYLLYRVVILFIINPFIIAVLFYPEIRKRFFRGYILMTGILLFVGGVQTAFFYWVPFKHNTGIWMVIVAAGAVAFILCQQKRNRYLRHQYEAEICFSENDSVFLKAYHDTGNLLRDPFTGKPVSIIDPAARELFPVPAEKIRYIPFHSVGKDHGLMAVFTVTKICIRQGNQETTIENAVIGLSENPLFFRQDIHMILHSELL